MDDERKSTPVDSLECGQVDKEKGGSDVLPPIVHDEAETKLILRKVDKRLLPVLTLLYLLSFLDRGNVGNARTLGMQTDVGLSNAQWNMCLTIFFFPYAAFEVPSNIVLKMLRPNLWLTILILAWGTTMTLMGLVQNYSGLLAARFFLGVTEAGFFPAATYLLTCWYRRYEMQGRLAIFFSAGSMAGAFSGLLAFAIQKMDGVGNLAGWRWILILEGLCTVIVGMACPFLLPNGPASAKFLSMEEKTFLSQRLENDSGGSGRLQTAETFQMRYVIAALTDWKIYLSVLIYWGNSICTYGFIYTLPSVIKELGYSASNAQLLTIPVYAFALIATVSAAFLSDRYKNRSNFIIYPFIIAAIGYIGLLALPHPGWPGATYGMLFVVAGGLYPTICGVISWNANNLAGTWKRSVGMAIQISIGNLGGAIGSNIYLAKEAPHYWTGYGFSLAIILTGLASAVILKVTLNRINKKRDSMSIDDIRAKYSEQELLDMGDYSPLFRYTL
ncbi:hypothetical protein VE04_07821 [Pseudogymnoascus sp. 24MN13]|nr:hypothetical protein VE04_07821 [Pseudogymnoascus sp. 24MN13]